MSRLLAFGLLLVVGDVWSDLTLMRFSQAFTPYVPGCLSQGARGDFDGDGRQDVARIQDRHDGVADIWVGLSASSAAVRLDGVFAAVIDKDIDHDGDLDLIVATASGDVLIWLNDGHGRFRQQERSPTRGFTSEPVVVNDEWNQPVAVGTTAPFITPRNRAETAVVVAQIRPPTSPPAFDRRFLLPQTLRAPPDFSVQHSLNS